MKIWSKTKVKWYPLSMRKFRFSFVISSYKDIHQIIPPSFHKLLLIEMTCKKWCPCFTLHLYFFLFTILASIREFFVDQIVFLFFCRSFLLAWWLFSYQQYSFTWKTRPTSGHCFHHHTSLWHSVCKYIYIYIYTTSEEPVNDQSYGVLDRYGITILYK